jgi:transposase
VKDEEALSNEALLDGCYAIKSNVKKEIADAQALRQRYCDLEDIERDFRTMKTAHLEMRPVYVRKEANTRGHVFVVMLALLLQRELERCRRDIDLTVEEAISELDSIRSQVIQIKDTEIFAIPTPAKQGRELLAKLNISLPSVLSGKTAAVHTKKKLM